MNLNVVKIVFERLNAKVFFGILFLYQIIFIFQGLDFADGGFDATFYQQIFRNPASVEFSFMYFLTGIIGGTFYHIFSFAGLLGIRVLGVIAITLTIIYSYYLLKDYLSEYTLKIGLFFATILLTNDPKEFNYDNLSPLLFVISLYYLNKGLFKNSTRYLFISGLIIGLNVFSRITNLLGIGFILTIVYWMLLNRANIKSHIKYYSYFIWGFVTMLLLVFSIMWLTDYLEYFRNSIYFAVHMGTNKESGHNLFSIISFSLSKLSISLTYISLILTIVIIVFGLNKLFLKASSEISLLSVFNYLTLIILALATYSFKRYILGWTTILLFFVGFVLASSLFILLTKKFNNKIKLLTFSGILFMLIYPLGSEEYVEMYSIWIILPISIDLITKLSWPDWIFNPKRLNRTTMRLKNLMINYVFFLACIICFFNAYFYPHADTSNRYVMFHQINNRHVKGILTTNERKIVVDDLLTECSKYVNENDYLLAYDCIPMLHFLTQTKPYMQNSWPGAYMEEDFKRELYKSYEKTRLLPTIVIQKVLTIGGNWPKNDFDYINKKENLGRNKILYEFIKKFSYRQAWENSSFIIFTAN